jgi:pseudouridine kinase
MARLPPLLPGVRLLILNEGELATRVGRSLRGEADLLEACREVRSQGVRDLIVTRGARGITHTTDTGVAHLEAQPADVVDVTGAGDAFAAAVCWSLGRGEDLGQACLRGLHLSALTIASTGTVSPQLTPATLGDITQLIHPD